jgi:hypothetical protein
VGIAVELKVGMPVDDAIADDISTELIRMIEDPTQPFYMSKALEKGVI